MLTHTWWNIKKKKRKKPFWNFKKARYSNPFQQNSTQEWERTAHKKVWSHTILVTGNFLSSLNGRRIKPREHSRAAGWPQGIDFEPCVLFEIICSTLRLNRLAQMIYTEQNTTSSDSHWKTCKIWHFSSSSGADWHSYARICFSI